jgi:pectinesterase
MDHDQNMMTAQGRRTDMAETTCLVIENCRIGPEQKLYPLRFKIPSYLGQPWKQQLGISLNQQGGWNGAAIGPGARTEERFRWKGNKVITNRNEALTSMALKSRNFP